MAAAAPAEQRVRSTPPERPAAAPPRASGAARACGGAAWRLLAAAGVALPAGEERTPAASTAPRCAPARSSAPRRRLSPSRARRSVRSGRSPSKRRPGRRARSWPPSRCRTPRRAGAAPAASSSRRRRTTRLLATPGRSARASASSSAAGRTRRSGWRRGSIPRPRTLTRPPARSRATLFGPRHEERRATPRGSSPAWSRRSRSGPPACGWSARRGAPCQRPRSMRPCRRRDRRVSTPQRCPQRPWPRQASPTGSPPAATAPA